MDHDERSPGPARGGGRSPGVLRAIGCLKLLKTLVLFVAGFFLLRTVARDGDGSHAASALLNEFGMRPGHHLLEKAAGQLGDLDQHKMLIAGLVSVAYGIVFLVEGVGLVLQKHWAEYMTVAVTASLLPFEIYELTRHMSAGKWLTLALNLAVVAYLVVRLRSERRERGGAAEFGRRGESSEAI